MNDDLERRNAVLNAWSCREFDMRYWKKTTLEVISNYLYYPAYDLKQARIVNSLDRQTLLECTEGLNHMDARLIYDTNTNKFYLIRNKKMWEVLNICGTGRSLIFSTVLNTFLEEQYNHIEYCMKCGDLCKGDYDSDSKVYTISCNCGTHRIRCSRLEDRYNVREVYPAMSCIFCGRELFEADDGKYFCIKCEILFEILNEYNTESETKEEC